MDLYLTPVSIGYLTQTILSAAIAFYLLSQLKGHAQSHTRMLTGLFLSLTVFLGLLFMDNAQLPSQRLIYMYLQNPLLGISIIFLLQFIYKFPRLLPQRRVESLIVLALSVLYTLWEAAYAVYRIFLLLNSGEFVFRFAWSDYILMAFFIWGPVACVRQILALNTDSTSFSTRYLYPFIKPPTTEIRAVRNFILVFLFIALINSLSLLQSLYVLPQGTSDLLISIGILVGIFLLSQSYLNNAAESTSFLVRLAGVTLTVMLAVLGIVGWIIEPVYASLFQPKLPGQTTLSFTPNENGGYNVARLPYTFVSSLGNRITSIEENVSDCSEAIDYRFLFFGKEYTQLYACDFGTISFGGKIDSRNVRYENGWNRPLLVPLYVDLSPDRPETSGVYMRQEPDRLIFTWNQLPSYMKPKNRFTFQAILYADGSFQYNYADLPAAVSYRAIDLPEANPWLIGALPAGRRTAISSLDLNLDFNQSEPGGILNDVYLEFRRHLNRLYMPLAILILAASILIVIGVPALFYSSLIKPLNTLLAGVRRLRQGDYSINLPEQHPDEIGFLTRAFNHTAAILGDLVQNLETRVAERTLDLDQTNAQLRAQIKDNEVAQITILEQQRNLSANEERVRLGRELHDGLGQLIGYVNVQVQAVRTLLTDGKIESAQMNLANLEQSARDAYLDIRGRILNLRTQNLFQRTFNDALRDYIHNFQEKHHLETTLSLPDDLSPLALDPTKEEQVLRIIQEALTNAAKHAAASHVEVRLLAVQDQIQVVVTDDGKGFDPTQQTRQPSHQGSFGLDIMRERAEQAGGTLEVRSAPEKGTTIIATLPRFLQKPSEVDSAPVKGMRVLLADDHPLFLDGLRNLLAARGLTIVAVARNGQEAYEKAKLLLPDVVVLDLNMPVMNGLEATRAIKSDMPGIKVVLLTASEDEGPLFEAIKSGASGYLLKSLEANKFCNLLTGLMSGEAALAPGMAERVMQEFARQATQPSVPDTTNPPEELSARQLEILRMVSEGMTYKEIGAALHLTEKTIKYHMGQILDRLHLKNRAQAVAYLKKLK